jgi:crotonobetainyl-CoA:carnitine CoA-transferase CaiB-like acyl-CoA transferase
LILSPALRRNSGYSAQCRPAEITAALLPRAGFCRATDRQDLLTDERFNTVERRSLNQIVRIQMMGESLKTRSREEWLERLDQEDVPCAPVLRRHEIVENPQIIANKLLEEIEQPSVGKVRQARPAAQFSQTPASIRGPAPRLGEHTEEILQELGYST